MSDIALQFMRECAGSPDARPMPGGIGHNWSADIDCGLFDYNDLNAVMVAAREWGRKERVSIRLETTSGDTVRVSLRWFGLDDPFHVVEHDNECHALLAACVEGARKLRLHAV